jgi:hypothetical protein
MPVMKRAGTRPDHAPDPRDRWTWASGDGCKPMMTGEAGYPNERAARRAWNAAGREFMWSDTAIGRIPPAARHYDGITDNGFDTFIAMWLRIDWDGEPVIDGINADRESVAEFRRLQPAAAKSIARYLDRYLAYLDQIEEDARALVGTQYHERGNRQPSRFSRQRYGDEEQKHENTTETV